MKATKAEVDAASFGPRDLKDPNSKEYAIQTVRHLKTLVEMKTTEEDRIRRELDVIDKYKHWTVLGYKNRDAMLQAEVGFKRNDIIRRIKSGVEPGVGTHGGDRKSEAVKDQGDTVTLKRGNALSYIAKRLARDAPDILDRWDAGEFKSAKAAKEAAIESGDWIVKPRGVKAKPAAAAPVEPNEIGGMISCTVEEMECTIDGKPVHKVAAYLLGIEAWIAKTRGRLRITDD